MVKIGYSGHRSSFNITVPSGTINGWSKEEIRDVSEKDAKKLLVNRYFYLAEEKKVEKVLKKVEKVEVEKEKVMFDFDGDGDFDSDDVSLGARAMAAARHSKKKIKDGD